MYHNKQQQAYDFSRQSAYFITVRTHNGRSHFGEVSEQMMVVNAAGEMVYYWWHELDNKYADVLQDAFIVMPNHVHGILIFEPDANTDVPATMRWFKAMTTNAYIRGVKEKGWQRFKSKLWQRRYYAVKIATAGDLERIRRYILANPQHWQPNQP